MIEKVHFERKVRFIGESERSKETFYKSVLKLLRKEKRRALRLFRKKHSGLLLWLSQQKHDFNQIKQNTVNYVVTGTVAIVLFTTTTAPLVATSLPHIVESEESQKFAQPLSNSELISRINKILEKAPDGLDVNDEEAIALLLSNYFGLNVKVELDGRRLNTQFGFIGTEQHLKRYPQEVLSEHFSNKHDYEIFGGFGMAYNRGAFGYFANSKQELTDEAVVMEKYYLAVQTFLIPDWDRKWIVDKEWFKFRKMLVFNPENGKAVITVIGDAGPAKWTGKQFGGSPEVIHSLGLLETGKKNKVLVLFIDESDNQPVKLGPITPASYSKL